MRPTVCNILFAAALERWTEEGWKVHWHMQPARNDAKMLATVDTEHHVVHLHPHDVGSPPEKSGLHEWLHILFSWDGEQHHESATDYMENWMWKRLTKWQRRKLLEIFVAPLKS